MQNKNDSRISLLSSVRLKEYIYRIDSYNTFSLNHHKLGFDRMKGWSETGPLISADLRALRQSLALPFVLSGIVTFWI